MKHATKKRKGTKRKATTLPAIVQIPVSQLKGFAEMFGGMIPAGAMAQIKREYKKNPAGAFKRCAASIRAGKFPGTKKNGGRRRPLRRNPVEAGADTYEKFHGKEAADIIEIETPIKEHGVLSGIGKLTKLVIFAVDGKSEVTLTNFKGALLAQNEEGTQLFIAGGDQSVRLSDFGIRTPHEQEVLGAVNEVWYDTEKLHLGDDGGKAIYHHTFGDKKSRLPLMIYDVRNKLLNFAGGGYDMPPVGIRG